MMCDHMLCDNCPNQAYYDACGWPPGDCEKCPCKGCKESAAEQKAAKWLDNQALRISRATGADCSRNLAAYIYRSTRKRPGCSAREALRAYILRFLLGHGEPPALPFISEWIAKKTGIGAEAVRAELLLTRTKLELAGLAVRNIKEI
ncbi:hypothetical protein SDC9_131014 [bioreactor metagenome]|uniref:Uncharacterized protein n=1 Tax=bioreactor metagenome TaxID=1076179 RepID=A0A645D3R3_9ZZZZ